MSSFCGWHCRRRGGLESVGGQHPVCLQARQRRRRPRVPQVHDGLDSPKRDPAVVTPGSDCKFSLQCACVGSYRAVDKKVRGWAAEHAGSLIAADTQRSASNDWASHRQCQVPVSFQTKGRSSERLQVRGAGPAVAGRHVGHAAGICPGTVVTQGVASPTCTNSGVE